MAKPYCLLLIFVCCIACGCRVTRQTSALQASSIYARNNLVAWCIVPFDIKKRNAGERAKMLKEMGITKMAYDWRAEHIPQFDTEIQTLKSNNIVLQSFWLMVGAEPSNDKNLQVILDALRTNNSKTQIWLMVSGIKLDNMSQQQKVDSISKVVGYVAREAGKIGCKVGLYNHGGWYGEPENQLAIIDRLKMRNVGMVYNFHHAKEQVERFPFFFPKILPYLFAINVSGLKGRNPATPVPVGDGDEELGMMRIVKESGYTGPIGIINEHTDPDAEIGLRLNMNGVAKIAKAIGDTIAWKTYPINN